MDSRTMPSPEELEKMLEKAKKEAEAALAKLSPEQRERARELKTVDEIIAFAEGEGFELSDEQLEAVMRAKKLIEEDAAAMRALVESASKLSAGAAPKAARECPHCLAPVSGRVCEYCGSPLED